MEEKDKKAIEVTQFEPEYSKVKALINLVESTPRFSKWMTTVSLATLGFFVTVLLQIKAQRALPHEWVAAMALSCLVISALIGFYVRCRSEIKSLYNQFEESMRALLGLLGRAADKGELWREIDKEEFEQMKEKSSEFFKKTRQKLGEYKIMWKILAQTFSLGFGIVNTVLYIGIYLFTK